MNRTKIAGLAVALIAVIAALIVPSARRASKPDSRPALVPAESPS